MCDSNLYNPWPHGVSREELKNNNWIQLMTTTAMLAINFIQKTHTVQCSMCLHVCMCCGSFFFYNLNFSFSKTLYYDLWMKMKISSILCSEDNITTCRTHWTDCQFIEIMARWCRAHKWFATRRLRLLNFFFFFFFFNR